MLYVMPYTKESVQLKSRELEMKNERQGNLPDSIPIRPGFKIVEMKDNHFREVTRNKHRPYFGPTCAPNVKKEKEVLGVTIK